MNFLNVFRKKKPNIIMILIDGAGREDARLLAPFYKNLKKEATFFRNMIVYAPYSIGSLNAIFSGMYGKLNGVNGYYRSYNFDHEHIYTLAQYLKDAGYHTEMDFVIEDVIPFQGFDKVRTFGKDETKDVDLVKRHSEILTRLKTKQPFFLFLDYNKIALKLQPLVIKKYTDFSEEYFQKKEENFRNYLALLKESADYLEKLLEKIKNLDLYDNSIIIIFADHGSSVGDRFGEKVYGVYLYDYTIKCFLYLLGNQFPKNLEIKSVIRSIDILPSLLEILNIKQKPEYKRIQGRSLLPFIHGKTEDRIAYSETGGLGGPTPSPEKHNVFAVRTTKWKLIYNETSKKKELYDLENDNEEKNNLIGKNTDIEEFLWQEMIKFGKSK